MIKVTGASKQERETAKQIAKPAARLIVEIGRAIKNDGPNLSGIIYDRLDKAVDDFVDALGDAVIED